LFVAPAVLPLAVVVLPVVPLQLFALLLVASLAEPLVLLADDCDAGMLVCGVVPYAWLVELVPPAAEVVEPLLVPVALFCSDELDVMDWSVDWLDVADSMAVESVVDEPVVFVSPVVAQAPNENVKTEIAAKDFKFILVSSLSAMKHFKKRTWSQGRERSNGRPYD
jgi:hypothetical protein